MPNNQGKKTAPQPQNNRRNQVKAKRTVNEEQVVIFNRHIGHLVLDVTKSEQHNSQLKITENPVEFGAPITDHSMITPASITISGMVVDYEFEPKPEPQKAAKKVRKSDKFLDEKKVSGLKNRTPSAAKKIKKNLAGFAPVSNDSVNQQDEEQISMQPWQAEEPLSWLKDHSKKNNRIEKIYEDFLALQKMGQTIEINTGIRLYRNMLIESLSVSQSSDGCAEFTIQAREVFIVRSKMALAIAMPLPKTPNMPTIVKPKPPSATKSSGRAKTQSSEKVKTGKAALKNSKVDDKAQSAKVNELQVCFSVPLPLPGPINVQVK